MHIKAKFPLNTGQCACDTNIVRLGIYGELQMYNNGTIESPEMNIPCFL